MNNNAFIGSAFRPTVPAAWAVIDVADFNLDGKPDYVLFNPSTRRTAIWYLNNNVFVGGAYGPTLPAGWTLVGAADFNGDGKNDYLLFNPSTRQSAIWYMNNNVLVSGAYGPIFLPDGRWLARPISTATAKMITCCSIRARGNRQSTTCLSAARTVQLFQLAGL